MQLEMFRGQELRSVIAWVHRSLGEEAMVVQTNVIKRPGGDVYEIVAALPEQLADYRRRLSEAPVSVRMTERRGRRPYVIALVGPSGAGKTTAAVKLALHPRGLGNRRVGLITLDTYRVGALEELQTYAEIAGLPLEVVYHAREVSAAMERMSQVEAVIVDTPGRSPNESGWVQSLREVKADEVHLVVPASLRPELARDLRDRLSLTGITHALFTKLDEVPGDVGLATMADTLDLPVRWVGDGCDIPGRLALAGSRIVRSLGKRMAPPAVTRHAV